MFNVLREIVLICCELWPNLTSHKVVKSAQNAGCMLNGIRLYLLIDDVISSYAFF